MKNIIRVLLGIVFYVSAQFGFCSELSGSTLWKIEKQQGDKKVTDYIFGTMHLPDPRVAQFPAPLKSSLDQVDTIVLEVILDQQAMQHISKRIVAKPGHTVEQILTPKQLKRLRESLQKRGVALDAVKQLKPWMIATQLMMPAKASETALPLEMQLTQYAESKQAQLAQLETVDEQVDLFDTLPDADQADLLDSSLNTLGELDALTELLMQAYLSGDLSKLEKISDQMNADEKNPHLRALMERLVEKRNHLMVERMQPFIQKGEAMIAVGALHLAGEQGILKLLQNQGWHVTSVPMKWQ